MPSKKLCIGVGVGVEGLNGLTVGVGVLVGLTGFNLGLVGGVKGRTGGVKVPPVLASLAPPPMRTDISLENGPGIQPLLPRITK